MNFFTSAHLQLGRNPKKLCIHCIGRRWWSTLWDSYWTLGRARLRNLL